MLFSKFVLDQQKIKIFKHAVSDAKTQENPNSYDLYQKLAYHIKTAIFLDILFIHVRW